MADSSPFRAVSAAFASVTVLFFAWGLITSLVDPLVAAVKGIFQLSDVEAQLSASAFFIAYGVMSFPAAAVVSRLQAGRSILLALGMMLAGCLVMLAAANIAVYGLVLAGLFVLASGITVLQVAANPLAAALGKPAGAHFRLTLSQTFNSLGTFIGPYVGAVLFLKGVEVKGGEVLSTEVRGAALEGIDRAFFWIAGLIMVLVVFMWASRGRIASAIASAAPTEDAAPATTGLFATIQEAFSSRWAIIGASAIFLYVGAEVAIGTQLAFLLNSDAILDVPLEDAGKMVSLYWGGAMIGRLIGTALLTRVAASRLLMAHAAIACALCLYVAVVGGPSAGYAALAIGLFNSIMFPVIFTLTLERSTASPAATSGLLCFAIIGGAIIPPLTGLISQSFDYSTSLLLPAACYTLVVAFALAAGRTVVRHRHPPVAGALH